MKKTSLRFLAYVIGGVSMGGIGFYVAHAPLGSASQPVLWMLFGGGSVGLTVTVILLLMATGNGAQAIRINPIVGLVAMDMISCIASAVAVFFAFDGFAPLITEPPVAAIIGLMYLPSTFMLAAVVTSSGTQSIGIDNIGLTIVGPAQTRTALWKDIKSLAPEAQYVAVTRLGVPMPEQLWTNISVVFSNDERASIFEPGLKSTRRYTVQQLREFAPKRLSSDIEILARDWV